MSAASLHKPRVGLALGSGSARGWAHIGVIRALEKAGIYPDLVFLCLLVIGTVLFALLPRTIPEDDRSNSVNPSGS